MAYTAAQRFVATLVSTDMSGAHPWHFLVSARQMAQLARLQHATVFTLPWPGSAIAMAALAVLFRSETMFLAPDRASKGAVAGAAAGACRLDEPIDMFTFAKDTA